MKQKKKSLQAKKLKKDVSKCIYSNHTCMWSRGTMSDQWEVGGKSTLQHKNIQTLESNSKAGSGSTSTELSATTVIRYVLPQARTTSHPFLPRE